LSFVIGAEALFIAVVCAVAVPASPSVAETAIAIISLFMSFSRRFTHVFGTPGDDRKGAAAVPAAAGRLHVGDIIHEPSA
jgi:hypothetical protein